MTDPVMHEKADGGLHPLAARRLADRLVAALDSPTLRRGGKVEPADGKVSLDELGVAWIFQRLDRDQSGDLDAKELGTSLVGLSAEDEATLTAAVARGERAAPWRHRRLSWLALPGMGVILVELVGGQVLHTTGGPAVVLLMTWLGADWLFKTLAGTTAALVVAMAAATWVVHRAHRGLVRALGDVLVRHGAGMSARLQAGYLMTLLAHEGSFGGPRLATSKDRLDLAPWGVAGDLGMADLERGLAALPAPRRDAVQQALDEAFRGVARAQRLEKLVEGADVLAFSFLVTGAIVGAKQALLGYGVDHWRMHVAIGVAAIGALAIPGRLALAHAQRQAVARVRPALAAAVFGGTEPLLGMKGRP